MRDIWIILKLLGHGYALGELPWGKKFSSLSLNTGKRQYPVLKYFYIIKIRWRSSICLAFGLGLASQHGGLKETPETPLLLFVLE